MLPIWVGFWVQNSLNKGPFFSRFSINMETRVDFPEIGKKLSKVGSFLQEFIIKMGMMATVSN